MPPQVRATTPPAGSKSATMFFPPPSAMPRHRSATHESENISNHHIHKVTTPRIKQPIPAQISFIITDRLRAARRPREGHPNSFPSSFPILLMALLAVFPKVFPSAEPATPPITPPTMPPTAAQSGPPTHAPTIAPVVDPALPPRKPNPAVSKPFAVARATFSLSPMEGLWESFSHCS